MRKQFRMDTTDPKQLREMRKQTEEFLLANESAAYRRLADMIEGIKREENAAAEAGFGRSCGKVGQALQASAEGVPPGPRD